MDIITKLTNEYFNCVNGLPPVHFAFVLRALLLFGVPFSLCAWAFLRGNESVMVQSLLLVVGLMLAATIPVQKFTIENRFVKGWVVAIACVLVGFIPALLPSVLVRELGRQRKLRVVFYLILLGLFIANLCQRRAE